jgi:hypothetical protein
MMTLDELKHEAELHGYRLVKKRASMKKVPCVCGRKQIWLVRDYEPVPSLIHLGITTDIPGWRCECPTCHRHSSFARTQENAVWMWNREHEAMEDN